MRRSQSAVELRSMNSLARHSSASELTHLDQVLRMHVLSPAYMSSSCLDSICVHPASCALSYRSAFGLFWCGCVARVCAVGQRGNACTTWLQARLQSCNRRRCTCR